MRNGVGYNHSVLSGREFSDALNVLAELLGDPERVLGDLSLAPQSSPRIDGRSSPGRESPREPVVVRLSHEKLDASEPRRDADNARLLG